VYAIREATVADAPAITQIWVRSIRAAYRTFVDPRWLDGIDVRLAAKARERVWAKGPCLVLLATSGEGEHVGYVEVAPAAEGEAFAGELSGLYLVPEAFGSGLAGALFDRGVEWLRARGHRSMGLWVLKENARARRFYERRGGVPGGEKSVKLAGEVHAAMSFIWDPL